MHLKSLVYRAPVRSLLELVQILIDTREEQKRLYFVLIERSVEMLEIICCELLLTPSITIFKVDFIENYYFSVSSKPFSNFHLLLSLAVLPILG